MGGSLTGPPAGAAVWILPTLVIKFIMATIMGTIMLKDPASRKLQVLGAAAGGIFQIIAYTIVKVFLVGVHPAIASLPNVTIQTTVGIVLFVVLASVMSKYIGKLIGKRAE